MQLPRQLPNTQLRTRRPLPYIIMVRKGQGYISKQNKMAEGGGAECSGGQEVRQENPLSSSDSSVQDLKCVFCKICSDPKQEVVYEDSDFVCLADKKPVSTHHYLVVPRKHITGPGQLTSADQSMVKRMADIGRQVLVDCGCDIEGSVLGFHWPPLITIKHLHMHVLSPASQMKWIHRVFVFKKDSYFFSSPEYVINYIKNKPS